MKQLLFLVGLFVTISVGAQSGGQKCTLPLVKWTMTLPAGFVSFPARDTHLPIVPGRRDTSKYVPTRDLLTAMSGPNLLLVSISGCDPTKPGDNVAWEKLAYDRQGGGKEYEVDSASGEIKIDGILFTTFVLVRKKNNLIQLKTVSMWTCYKGYNLSVQYQCTDKKAGEQLYAMLQQSSFH
jgi:hypothetical protein